MLLAFVLRTRIRDANDVYIILGVVAVAGVVLYVAWWREKQRREKLMQVAMELGYNYEPEALVHAELPQFKLFDRGRSRQSKNVLRRGAGGRETIVFDYQYTTGSGKNKSTHRQTVAAFRWAGTQLPRFELGPESWWHAVGEALGWKDIDFDSFPEFSRRYRLKGDDETAIRSVFTPGVIGFFETQEPKWTIEAWGDWLIVHKPGSRPKPEELREFLDESAKVAAGVFSQVSRAAAGF